MLYNYYESSQPSYRFPERTVIRIYRLPGKTITFGCFIFINYELINYFCLTNNKHWFNIHSGHYYIDFRCFCLR